MGVYDLMNENMPFKNFVIHERNIVITESIYLQDLYVTLFYVQFVMTRLVNDLSMLMTFQY